MRAMSVSYKVLFLIVFGVFQASEVWSVRDRYEVIALNATPRAPENIRNLSNFITQFQKVFEKDDFARISRPQFGLSFEEDGPELAIIQSVASVIKKDALSNVTKNDTLPQTMPGYNLNITHGVHCLPYTPSGIPTLEIVNVTRLNQVLNPNPNVTNRFISAPCVLVIFYSSSCPFTALAAPHFNVLARAFPRVKMVALDATIFHSVLSLNSRYGIVGLPTAIMFHGGWGITKYLSDDFTLEGLTRFLSYATNMTAADDLYVMSMDFGGPLSSTPKYKTDYKLYFFWSILIIYLIIKVFHNSDYFESTIGISLIGYIFPSAREALAAQPIQPAQFVQNAVAPRRRVVMAF